MRVALQLTPAKAREPGRLAAKILQRPQPGVRFTATIVALMEAMAKIAALPENVAFADAPMAEWASVLEGLDAMILVANGATGDLLRARVRGALPSDLTRLYAKREQAMLRRSRRLIEQLEDFLDGKIAARNLGEGGAPVPYEQVRRELGLG